MWRVSTPHFTISTKEVLIILLFNVPVLYIGIIVGNIPVDIFILDFKLISILLFLA